jgi:lipopolysaccharide export system protein LptA
VFSSPKAGVAANSQGRCGATQRLEADGDVYYVTPSQAVRGDHAVYTADNDTILITGGVVVTQGKSVARGDRMTVIVKTGQVNLVSSAKGRGKPGRVRGVFYPSETSDTAAPASK